MELTAVIKGLEALKENCTVLVTSDSEYVVKAMQSRAPYKWRSKGWIVQSTRAPVKNQDLWTQLMKLCDNHIVTFNWVRGHDGHVENERCDFLATEASK